jgi:hypothetical protein
VDDLYQEVLINIWNGLKNFKGNSKLTTWLYRVTLNTTITFNRTNKKHISLFNTELPDTFEEAINTELQSQENRVNKLHYWMQQEYTKVLPKSTIGKAFAYSLNLWDKLSSYTQDGKYLIDNNLIENAIRPLALSRKNYLFAGSHNAAQHAAMMYSFFATCKINEVNPYLWLHDVFKRLPEHKANKLEELLPQNWKNPAAV